MTSDPTQGQSRPDDTASRMSAAAPSAPAAGDASRPETSAPSAAETERRDDAAPAAKQAGKRPRKRRRDGALVGYLSGLFTFLTLLVLGLGAGLYYGHLSFDAPGPLAQETTVTIARNQGVNEIADSLARAGVIDQPTLFKFGVAAFGAKDRMRYGEYAFPAKVSMRGAMDIIVSGKSIEHAFTIPEGLTSLQVVERLRDQPLLTGDVKETPPEGSLLPETYKFMRGTPREQLIARIRQHRDEVVNEIWKARDPASRLKSADELVTLASLVEKETGIASERPQVAAVFHNRLARGMKLQSDPTIVYGIVGGRGTLGRSLTRSDIQSKTPFNTYVVQGLPAGPIANPGRDALEAAANPPKTKDLYFVADGSGGHAFAPTLVDHNRNVANWRRIEKTRGAAADRLAPDEQTPEPSGDPADREAEAEAAAAPAAATSAPPKPAAASAPKPKPAAGANAPKPKPSTAERRQPRER